MGNTRYIGLLECSKLAKTSDAKGREFITESRWINKEPIQALSFVTDETFPSIKDNILLNNLRKQYDKNKKQKRKKIKETKKALDSAKGFIRRKLCDRIDIRHMPELEFIYDESIAYGKNIENIIDNLKK